MALALVPNRRTSASERLVQGQSGGKPWIRIHVISSLSKNIAFSDLIGLLTGASSKAPQREGTPWLWVAEWIRCLLRQRVQRGIGHGLYRPTRQSIMLWG